MRLSVFFLAIILSHSDCLEKTLTCPGNERNIMADFGCVENPTCSPTSNVTFSWLLDGDKVLLKSNMFDNLCAGRYYLKLDVNEFLSEDECRAANVNKCGAENFIRHTTKYVRIVKENGEFDYPCREIKNITLNMIFKGCYRFTFEKIHEKQICSEPVFLNNNLTKNSIIKKSNFFVKTFYQQEQNHMEHRVRSIKALHVRKLILTVKMCEEGKHCTGCVNTTKKHEWLFNVDHSGELVCIRGNKDSNCSLIDGDEIKCINPNYNNQPQCAIVTLTSNLCDGGQVWQNISAYKNDKCIWSSVLEKVIANEEPYKSTGNEKIALLLYIVCGLSIIFCFILLFIWRKKVKEWITYLPLPSRASPFIEYDLPDVLLLYPRDCEPFMNLMKSFRKMLKEVVKCEVHDCFDHHLAEEIARGRMEWLNRHLAHKNMKVLVLETECAVLHQKALFQSTKLNYQHPSWLDDMFLCGLQELSSVRWINNYNRIFVVRINNFTGGNDYLSVITPKTRYTLPQHMDKLLSRMFRQTNESIEYKEAFQSLVQDFGSLVDYKGNNVNYLDEMLENS